MEPVLEYELIFVDDGSTDDTYCHLRSESRKFKWLHAIRHSECCGQSAAIRTGVRASRFDWIATLDGDGRNEPGNVLHLLQAYLKLGRIQKCTIVTADGPRRLPWRRMSLSLADAVRSRLLGEADRSAGCGLMVFDRDTFTALPYFDHMHRILPDLIRRAGGRVVAVRVPYRSRRLNRPGYGGAFRQGAQALSVRHSGQPSLG